MSRRNTHAAKVARRADRAAHAIHAAEVHRAANAPLVVLALMASFGWPTPKVRNRAERRGQAS